jgi:hypothetical protein
MMRHSVLLKLKTDIGSEAEKGYFEAVEKLAEIPDVKKFEILKQTSTKNKFEYGISMEFDTLKQYDTYTNHPQHVAFVQDF